MSADEEIAPEIAKGCAVVVLILAALGGLIYLAIRGLHS